MTLSIRRSLQGTHLFITGATGFLGLALVEKLLRNVPDCRLTLLVRGADSAAAKQRFVSLANGEPLFAGLPADCFERVDCIAGDITAPQLGMPADARAALRGRVALVINSAASVDFDEPLDEATTINIEGPLAVQAFANEIGAGLLHISTAYVCGDRAGAIPDALDTAALDGEAALAELRTRARAVCTAHGNPDATSANGGKKLALALSTEGRSHANAKGWPDIYTYTKYIAEVLLAARRGTQPLGIFRPTVIESAAGGQHPGWLRGVKVMDTILAAYGKGMIPGFPIDLDVPLDVIPVDMVASAVLAQAADMLEREARKERGDAQTPSVCQLGTSVSNPLLLRVVSDCTYAHYRANPLPDVRGNPIVVRKPRVPLLKNRFRSHATWLERYLAALNGMLWLSERKPFDAFGKFRRGVLSRQKNVRRYLSLVKMFGSYANTRRHFSTQQADALYARLDAEERQLFNFAHAGIDWRRYLLEHHLPNLDRLIGGNNLAGNNLASNNVAANHARANG
ncbi:MAG: SDR family oxidoreductase [Pseudomonadota bacterium]|nr:SDR family oxidoreductase [Pseudomonadota bacterium]